MANKLFAPRGRPAGVPASAADRSDAVAPPPAPGPKRFVDPIESAFSIEVPVGWSAAGGLQKFGRNRYISLDVTGPNAALVFHGDPDQPQRYVVPGPWMVPGLPGERTLFADGQKLYVLPLATAPQMGEYLARKRFGPLAVTHADPDPGLIQAYREGAIRAGGNAPAFVDACTLKLVSADSSRRGMISLVVFGGGMPGETWQVENISGFWASATDESAAHIAYDAIKASLDVSGDWKKKNPDELSDEFKLDHAKKRAALDTADINAERNTNRAIAGIRGGALMAFKNRRGAWPDGGWAVGAVGPAPAGSSGIPGQGPGGPGTPGGGDGNKGS